MLNNEISSESIKMNNINILQARLFAIGLIGKKLANLSPNEEKAFHLIKDNEQKYDIKFKIDNNGRIDALIGSFDSHLVRNRYLLWLPFIIIGVISNNVYFFQQELSLTLPTTINFLITFIGIAGMPSVGFKPYFEKKYFYQWYLGLVATALFVAVLINF